MIDDFIKALMQATGDTSLLEAIGEETKVIEQDNERDGPPEVSNLGKVHRLREAQQRFMTSKPPFGVGDLITARPDALSPFKPGHPLLVLNVYPNADLNWSNRVPELPTSYRANLRVLAVMDDYIVPIMTDAACFEPYTGERI